MVRFDSFHVNGLGHRLMVSNAYQARKRQDSIHLALMSARRGRLPMLSELDATYRRHVATNPLHHQLILLSLATLS
ncbi:hypothetical protein BYT27DRAFT_7201882 [Phlegmacium glaucopus]|nr:hypothetical protein BYT27DRAFT_7201882 [Phlegmacium glaucopus]